jgi:hypothetical protein
MSQFNGLLRKYIDMVNEASPTTVPPTAAAMAAPAPAAAPAGTPNPYPPGSGSAIKFDTLSEKDKAWLTKGGGKPNIDPAYDPKQLILSRAPDGGKPAAAPAAAAPAAAPALTAADQEDADMGKAMAANAQAATQAANGVNAAGQNVTMPNGINPETGTPTTVASAPAGQAAKPRIPAKADPAVQKIQQDLIAKGAKIKADGVMGPATQAAMKQFGQGGKSAAPNYSNSTNPMMTPSGQDFNQMSGESVESTDHVMYNEDQALARIIQLARG